MCNDGSVLPLNKSRIPTFVIINIHLIYRHVVLCGERTHCAAQRIQPRHVPQRHPWLWKNTVWSPWHRMQCLQNLLSPQSFRVLLINRRLVHRKLPAIGHYLLHKASFHNLPVPCHRRRHQENSAGASTHRLALCRHQLIVKWNSTQNTEYLKSSQELAILYFYTHICWSHQGMIDVKALKRLTIPLSVLVSINWFLHNWILFFSI